VFDTTKRGVPSLTRQEEKFDVTRRVETLLAISKKLLNAARRALPPCRVEKEYSE
jgi:hypothetical protein